MTAPSRLHLFSRAPLGRRLLRRSLALPVVAACVLTGAAVVALPAVTSSAATAATGSPLGAVDTTHLTPGGLTVSGWTFDPNAPTTTNGVSGWVDGTLALGVTAAGQNRPDIARAYPKAGPLHGFGLRIPVPEGRHTVCVHATNIGAGGAVSLRCTTATFDYSPVGVINDLSAARGAIHLRGWAIDSDAWTGPVTIRVTLDGVSSTIVANTSRRDVAATRPNTGTTHGFDATYPVAQGTHRVCVTALNIGYGTDTALACQTLVLDDSPLGGLNSPQVTNGKLRVWGWDFDREAPTTPLLTVVRIDQDAPMKLSANRSRPDVAEVFPGTGSSHGFESVVTVPEGTHTVCAAVRNIGYGSDRALGCRTVTVDFTPRAALSTARPTPTGLSLTGWAYDPDTTKPVSTIILLDGRNAAVVAADRKGSTHSGHNFTANLPATSGTHTVCAVAVNVLWGSHNSTASCATSALSLSPLGSFDSLTRVSGSTNLLVSGWTADPDTIGALAVTGSIDGRPLPTLRASSSRPDVGAVYPSLGSAHGLSVVLPAGDGEHRVCLLAMNVGGGTDKPLGCRVINAVHPVVPSAPGRVTTVPGFGGATVNWTPPASDGGAPVTGYVVTASPGNASVTVSATSTSTVVVGLRASTVYSFTVRATNLVGASAGAVSAAVRTEAGPPAQRTPAPISTSRYIRNVRGSSPSELATMRAEGAGDAQHNPSGHGYLILLDIGGQDAYNGGVVLSAGVRFVSYYDLVRDVQAYLDGYASAQRASAPVVVAVGTNNDMDVSAATGRVWAATVVNPLVAYARRHVGMTVAGANDIEPGFRASYSATRNWLSGYLAATSAPFIFNGSADGCAWTTTNRRCNNGWTMAGLHYLASGAAPTRMLNLPQIYNNTMADQWKFISLTGVVNHLPRINFAGVLTEATACAQAGGCGSMSGRSAWTRMWNDLQSDARLKVSSLPYATDLRIDR